jgi:general secretion pathway protein M
MIDRLRIYWAERSEREQRLLGIMFALLAVVVLWFGIIVPLKYARADARERLDRATSVSGQVLFAAELLRRDMQTAPVPLGTTLAVAVGTAATEAGFTPSRLDSQGDNGVMISISSAKSAALFAWLDTLASRGIFVDQITVRPNGDTTVSCDATLKHRQP